MKRYWEWLYYNQPKLYKGFILLVLSASILYLFPKGSKFQFEFQKGFPWQHNTLFAPFDFSILKTAEEIAQEQSVIENQQAAYYRLDTSKLTSSLTAYNNQFENFFSGINPSERTSLFEQGRKMITTFHSQGIFPPNRLSNDLETINLVVGNAEEKRSVNSFIRLEQLEVYVTKSLPPSLQKYRRNFYQLLFRVLDPNVQEDKALSQRIIDEQLRSMSLTKGLVKKGRLIIAQNELVVGERYQILESLKAEYQSSSLSQKKQWIISLGYAVLIALVLFMLSRFMYLYRRDIFNNNKQLTFIFFNVLLIVALAILVINFDPALIYGLPLCILPLTLKAFFDARLGLFTHVLTILMIGFVVPNGFEFIFLQLLAGVVTIQSSTQLYQRANLFLSVGQIVLVYMTVYVAFTLIHEGQLDNLSLTTISLFFLNGLLTLFVQPLIYLFERLFGLTSDISLLELSDTNAQLLKALSDQAPGTFHHSLQVANLAEAAASEIGANTLLIRVGALYHDIGKMKQPTYFSENQKSTSSPHQELLPRQSAAIIINHVREGIRIAKKYNLPERVIDFIRTHHGTSLVYYFYKQEKEMSGIEPENITDFQYPGPKPFSKETAILMMADAVEAASKSLKEPNLSKIESFVRLIIQKQLDDGQFSNCNITLAEIERIKKILIRKLSNIYHLRIEYPE